jgi:hypothetical protein
VGAIINFLELVIGVAVLCENKANFIQRIFSLDQSSQEVLKGMVERAMQRTWDVQTEEEEGGLEGELGEDNAYLSSQLQQYSLPSLLSSLLRSHISHHRAHDLIASQTAELEELRTTFAEVVASNSSLKAEIEVYKEAVRISY